MISKKEENIIYVRLVKGEEIMTSLYEVIRKYKPDALITYDPFGGYGHPDHIQTHRIGTAAYFAASDLDKFPLKENQEVWIPERLYYSAWSKTRLQSRRQQMFDAGIISEEEFNRLSKIKFEIKDENQSFLNLKGSNILTEKDPKSIK